jgi:hypothetical protein
MKRSGTSFLHDTPYMFNIRQSFPLNPLLFRIVNIIRIFITGNQSRKIGKTNEKVYAAVRIGPGLVVSRARHKYRHHKQTSKITCKTPPNGE